MAGWSDNMFDPENVVHDLKTKAICRFDHFGIFEKNTVVAANNVRESSNSFEDWIGNMQNTTNWQPKRRQLTKATEDQHGRPSMSRNTGRLQSTVEFDNGAQPHTPGQELTHFGTWVGQPILVPPKDCNQELAKSMLNRFGLFASQSECWQATAKEHRSKFIQVREFELPRASIRLPQGRLFVTVTESDKFNEIKDPIPQCVQTRLAEFLAGAGKQQGVKVYYLKPLCVEIGSDLIFTTRKELKQAIAKIQAEVFAEYRRHYLSHRARRMTVAVVDALLAIPKSMLKFFIERKKREIEAFHAKLEFERRKRALKAVRHWKKYRKGDCSFDEVLALTSTPDRKDVIDYYVQEKALSNIDRQMFLIASAATLPWFATLSLAAYQLAVVLTATASVAVCDPVFVAEMPGSRGRLLKIGHFDEVDGVLHVEI